MALQELLLSRYRFVPQILEALRLVDVHAEDEGGTGLLDDSRPDTVKLHGHATLGASWYSVESAELFEEHLEVKRTHFSLTGPASPLLDADVFRAIHIPTVRDFLDILNHRIFVTFYRAWATTRPDLTRAARGQRDLIAVRRQGRTDLGGCAWALDRGRSAMLGHLIEALDVDVELVEGAPVAVQVDEASRSGRLGMANCNLGEARLGDTAWVAESFRVDVGPVPEADEGRWRPSAEDSQLRIAVTIVNHYLDPPAQFTIRVLVAPERQSFAPLGIASGRSGARLGGNAFLGGATQPYHVDFSFDPKESHHGTSR